LCRSRSKRKSLGESSHPQRIDKWYNLDRSFIVCLKSTIPETATTFMTALFRVFLIFVCFFIVGTRQSATAAELEVDNVRGNDLQDVGNERTRTPFRTIQRAIQTAVIGDVIRVRKTNQPYRECVSLSTNHQLGTSDFPLVIDGGGATLDGSQALSVVDWTARGNDLFELKVPSPGYVRIFAAPDQPVPENLGSMTDLKQLQPLQYARNSGAVFFRTRPGDVPQAYGLSVSKEQTGITLYDVSNIVIRNFTVTGYRLDGINCHDLVNNVSLENIVAIENGRSGISVGGASQILLRGSSLRGNGKAQLRAEGQSLVELLDTKIEADDSEAIERAGGRVIEKR
jgi:hypothetical protein